MQHATGGCLEDDINIYQFLHRLHKAIRVCYQSVQINPCATSGAEENEVGTSPAPHLKGERQRTDDVLYVGDRSLK